MAELCDLHMNGVSPLWAAGIDSGCAAAPVSRSHLAGRDEGARLGGRGWTADSPLYAAQPFLLTPQYYMYHRGLFTQEEPSRMFG